MPDVSFTNLLVVAAVAVLAPMTVGFAPRLRIPAVVLEIIGGIVVGPSGFGWVRVDLPVQILALVMPDAASMRELRQLYPAASVLAVVGVPAHHGCSDLAVELLNSGADACVIRPTGVELRAHLNALLRRRP